MQSILGTNLSISATAAKRQPICELRMAFSTTAAPGNIPADWATSSTDVSAYVTNVTWSRQLDANGPLATGKAPVATLTFTLANTQQAFSPYNSSGPYYSLLSQNATTPGSTTVRVPTVWQTPVRLRMGFYDLVDTKGNEWLNMFHGFVDDYAEGYGVDGDRVTVRCVDYAGILIDPKLSTTMYENYNARDLIDIIVRKIWPAAPATIIPDPNYVPYHDFSRPLFTIPYAWLDDDPVYAECCKLAASEGGYFFVDENGYPLFRNSAWWLIGDSASSVFEFTTARFSDLSPTTDYSTKATGALVEYEGRAPAGEQVIWKSTETIVINPGTVNIEARFSHPVVQRGIIPPVYTTDWLPVDAGGNDMSGAVTVRIDNQYAYAQRCRLTFTNTSQQAAFVTNMQLRGQAIYGGPQETVERTVSTALVGAKQVRVSGNPYIQTKPQAELAADLAADRVRYPRLTYRINGAPAIPWLQLGDRITITASEPITSSRTAIITKLDFSWSPDQPFLMSVEAIDTAALFPYPNFFIVGVNRYAQANYVTYR